MAAASGVLLALSFPKFGHPAASWIALAPLLTALGQGSLRRAFGLGLLTGVIYFAGTLYWITTVMAVYGGLQLWVAVLVNILLIAYLALFPALFALIVRRLRLAFGNRALLAAPFVWVATELGRTHLFGGFPWVLLGYSQAGVLPVAQLASVFGVFGLSGLVAAVNAALARVVARPGDRPAERFAPLAVCALLVIVVASWGGWRLAGADWTHAGAAVKVGLLQGNVAQNEKWDDDKAAGIFASYLRMTREAIAKGAELVIWPESATPYRFREGDGPSEEIRKIAREARVPILLGSDELEPGNPVRYYNSAFMVRPDGRTGGVYRKMHLVPFGEYVPLKRLFFFAGPLVEAVSDFSPGDQAALLPVDGHRINVSICYEIVYPNLVRDFVLGGSELLTTITNDAWFGDTSAPHQHFAQASLRAVEQGRYLVRAANTGISGIVDPHGRVLAKSGLFEPALLVGEARYLRGSTFYARVGDLFAYLSAAVTLVLLLQSRVWRQSTI
jgi:apolipoprotein N-acyltransferase